MAISITKPITKENKKEKIVVNNSNSFKAQLGFSDVSEKNFLKNEKHHLSNLNTKNFGNNSYQLSSIVEKIFNSIVQPDHSVVKNTKNSVGRINENKIKNFIEQVVQQAFFDINKKQYYIQAMELGLTNTEIEMLFNFISIVELTNNTAKGKSVNLKNPKEVFYNFSFLRALKREFFYLVGLDDNACMIDSKQVANCTGNRILIHPKDILKEAIKIDASSLIVIHNHPSGNTMPSEHDLVFTKKLHQATMLMGLRLLDHVIIGDNYYSFREQSLILD